MCLLFPKLCWHIRLRPSVKYFNQMLGLGQNRRESYHGQVQILFDGIVPTLQ